MKTPIGIASYVEAKKAGIISGPGMIVVKASLKIQWAAEVKKFSDLRPVVIKTYKDCVSKIESKIKRLQKKLEKTKDAAIEKEIAALSKEAKKTFASQFENADLFILNYETLKDTEVKKTLHKIKPEYIFADEIHYVKSDTVKRSKALCEFNDATVKVGATATPVQRDPRDIYGLYKFIKPDLFPKKGEFGALYVKWGSYGRVIGSRNEDKLNQKISPYMIIKTKEEVAKQLPKLVVSQRYCDLEPAQVEMSQLLMDELEALKEKEKKLAETMTEAQLKISEEYLSITAGIMSRQTFAQELADSEKLLSESDSEMAKRYVTGSKDNKLELLVDLVSEIIESGEKVCIFSKFAKMQKIIADRFQKDTVLKDAKIAYVNGSLNSQQRFEELYTKFRDNEEYKVLIMSDAGAEGKVLLS